MPGLKITLLQQPLVWMDGPANLRHFDRQLETVTGRDLIVLPEMFTTGFAMEAAGQSLAQETLVAWLRDKAQQTDALVNDYDLALYVANWPAPRSLHWQTLLAARAIENQAYVAGCNRVGTDGNGHHYRGDSRVINPQGEVIATAEAHQATRIDAELSLSALKEYRETFPAWQDADPFTLR